MLNYDINIIKNNIFKMMKEKRITQTVLARKLDMQQSGVSAALNPQNSTCFTIGQIVMLADIFDCTTDEILLPPTEKKKNEIETLSDALEMLFKIDKFVNFSIDDFFDETGTIFALYSKSKEFRKIINKWKSLKNNPLEEPFKSEIIQLWQNHVIEQYKDYKKEDFVNSCLEDFSDVPFH